MGGTEAPAGLAAMDAAGNLRLSILSVGGVLAAIAAAVATASAIPLLPLSVVVEVVAAAALFILEFGRTSLRRGGE